MIPVPIPPLSMLPGALEFSPMQFALCHVAANNPEYLKAYGDVGRNHEQFLILDNGAFENGTSDLLPQLIEVAHAMCPNEIVLPDRMFMADETIKLSTEGLAMMQMEFDDYPGPKFAGVVHGLNHKEWLDCAYAMFDMGVDTLMIPKDYEAWPGGREVLVAMVQKLGLPIHLLGMEKNVQSVFNWRCTELVRSMDTAKPYIHGWNSSNMWHNPHSPRQSDFFTLEFTPEQQTMVHDNLMIWQTLCDNLG